MAIPAAAKATPLPRTHASAPFIEADGRLSRHGSKFINDVREHVVGSNRITPCSASGTNVITLTPNDDAPLIEKYVDYEQFPFVAANTSNGAVTMTVVPRKGTLATLKAYIANGATQASTGDVVAGSFYIASYVDSMDAGAGGFVLK